MSNVTRLAPRQTVEAEAAAWIARLDCSEPTAEDLAALRAWIRRSPAHRAELVRLAEVWNRLDVLTELAATQPGRAAQPRPRPRRVPVAVGLAALVLVAVGAVLLASRVPEAPTSYAAKIATEIGERRELPLPDGSQVLVNTDSQVEVEYAAGERRLRLVRGEAFFTVAKDRHRPFLVYAGASVVRATGTAFAVRMQTGRIDVTVSEGTVEVGSVPMLADGGERAEPATRVDANRVATLTPESVLVATVAPPAIEQRLAWKKGVLVFAGEPLSVVVDEVSRYSRLRIEVADERIGALPIGGYLRIGENREMLEALERIAAVDVEWLDATTVRLSARAAPAP